MEEQKTKRVPLEEIDFLELAGKVLARWRFVLKVTICFMVLGIVMALSTIKSYTAQVVIAPEAAAYGENQDLMALASFAGFDMDNKGDAIYPLLYPEIIKSLPFLCSLLEVPVQSIDGRVDTTFVYYQKKLRKRSWVSSVKYFPKMVVSKCVSLFNEEVTVGNPNVFDSYRLSKSQMMLVGALEGSIDVIVDKKTEVISLSFTDQDPLIAAIMVDAIKERLQERITEYQTKKAMIDCDYIEKLYIEAKGEYEKAQETYAAYVDRNRNVTQERFLVEKERLAADRDLKNSLYMQWAQQLQLAKAKVLEYTPAFTTLKPAAVPVFPSSMSRPMILMLYTFLGGVLAVMYILFKDCIVGVFRELFKRSKSL